MKHLFYIISFFAAISCSSNKEKENEQLFNTSAEMYNHFMECNLASNQYSNEVLAKIKSELITSRSPELVLRRTKLQSLLIRMENIDKETKKMLLQIENYKFDLLKNAKENITVNSNGNFLLEKDNRKLGGFLEMDALQIKNKGNVEVAKTYFTSGNLPNKQGNELWKSMLHFRKEVVRIAATYSIRERSFSINPKKINEYSSKKDLQRKVSQLFENSNINLMEDKTFLEELYIECTFLSKEKDGNHWIVSKFKETSLINALNQLTILERKIINAKNLAFALIDSKFNNCGFAFSIPSAIVFGPETSEAGKSIQLHTIYAALDFDNQPIVKCDNPNATIIVQDGVGRINVTPNVGQNIYKGTIALKNQSGVLVEKPWQFVVNGTLK